jgi:hypothetical protein
MLCTKAGGWPAVVNGRKRFRSRLINEDRPQHIQCANGDCKQRMHAHFLFKSSRDTTQQRHGRAGHSRSALGAGSVRLAATRLQQRVRGRAAAGLFEGRHAPAHARAAPWCDVPGRLRNVVCHRGVCIPCLSPSYQHTGAAQAARQCVGRYGAVPAHAGELLLM